jgi:large subunit ribosomal protein L33
MLTHLFSNLTNCTENYIIARIEIIEFSKMAKKKKNLIKLVSSAKTGYFLIKERNPKTTTEKLKFRKYDPIAKKHVIFDEKKA